MTDERAVSVVMPLYNAAAHLPEALDSMLAQTLANFELIAVDDGSADGTGALLAAYAGRDARLRVVHNQQNRGLTSCLNQALDLAHGRYIARMDGDDISQPERLARQAAFLDANPRVGVCGSWVQTIGPLGGRVEQYPADDAAIRCELLFRDVLAHPSVMLRRAVLDAHSLRYDASFRYAQDYDLWVRLAERCELANIPEVLLHYRMHVGQIGHSQRHAQDAAAARTRLAQLRALGLEPTAEERATHEALSTVRFAPSRALVVAADAWLRRILATNQSTGRYAEPELRRALGRRWYTVCRLSTVLGPWVWWRFQRSPLGRAAPVGRLRLAKFALKALALSPTS